MAIAKLITQALIVVTLSFNAAAQTPLSPADEPALPWFTAQLPVPKSCPGCCSYHGGITSSCAANGHVVCVDGTTSPTCACSSCGISPPPPPMCSYAYSAWSPCHIGNTQTRTVVSNSPYGCTGTPGPLVQSCVYVACIYTYTAWSPCQLNNTQTRSVASSSPTGCTSSPDPLVQACTYVPPTSAINYTALWWNPAESGWGINVNHQDSTLFATLFTYAPSGAPMWLVASNMIRQADGTFAGPLYRVSGPPLDRSPWTGAINVSQVGGMTMRFTSENQGLLSYTMGSVSVLKAIEKQIFGVAPICVESTASRESATNYQDLWWNSQESGWGINLTHQGNIIFATLFTYDASGNDLWLVASNLSSQPDGSYSGPLYTTSGPIFNSSWNPAMVMVSQVGNMTVRFSSGEAGTLNYTYNGSVVTKSIQRQVFGVSVPLCR
jgi:hypothetical protein